MNVRVAEPLPECALCDTPTGRKAHAENGGLCTPCADGIAAITVQLNGGGGAVDLDRERARRREADELLDDDALTAFSGRYLPPVPPPRQLTLDPEPEQ